MNSKENDLLRILQVEKSMSKKNHPYNRIVQGKHLNIPNNMFFQFSPLYFTVTYVQYLLQGVPIHCVHAIIGIALL